MASSTKLRPPMPAPQNPKPKSPRKWKPAPPDLIATFTKAVEGVPGAQLRKMFGFPAAFLNGNLFTGLFEDTMILRLSPADRATLLKIPGARPFEPMKGRPSREYIIVPDAILAYGEELTDWVEKARAFASSLPPKEKRATKPRKRRPKGA